MPEDAIEVARIGEAWGIKGWFRVEPHAGDPKAVFSSSAGSSSHPRRRGGPHAPALSSSAWPTATRRRAPTMGDRGAAGPRARIFISRSSFPTPGNDEFYWVDLIGLAVVNRQGFSPGTVVGPARHRRRTACCVVHRPARICAPCRQGRLHAAEACSPPGRVERLIPSSRPTSTKSDWPTGASPSTGARTTEAPRRRRMRFDVITLFPELFGPT
jgi:ribosomal 30S subunit maturation factor RimM